MSVIYEDGLYCLRWRYDELSWSVDIDSKKGLLKVYLKLIHKPQDMRAEEYPPKKELMVVIVEANSKKIVEICLENTASTFLKVCSPCILYPSTKEDGTDNRVDFMKNLTETIQEWINQNMDDVMEDTYINEKDVAESYINRLKDEWDENSRDFQKECFHNYMTSHHSKSIFLNELTENLAIFLLKKEKLNECK